MHKKVVFIGRKYHAKTKSDELVLSLLKKEFEVTVIRREELSDQETVKMINQMKPFAVLFWCLPPSFTFHLIKLRCKNVFWAPMWDGFQPLSFKKKLIFSFYNIKILCFSKVLSDYFAKTPLKSAYWQCFLEPKKQKEYKNRGPYSFFFWQREKEINLDKIVEMLGKENISKIIYKSEIGDQISHTYDFEIEKLPDWVEKKEYEEKIESSDFFIAPRRAEGIGFSFLEPMSQGLPIIAYDNSTMNEYIEDGSNGYLFGDDFKLKQPLQSPKSLSSAIDNLSNQYYESWEDNKSGIVSFIANKGKVVK